MLDPIKTFRFLIHCVHKRSEEPKHFKNLKTVNSFNLLLFFLIKFNCKTRIIKSIWVKFRQGNCIGANPNRFDESMLILYTHTYKCISNHKCFKTNLLIIFRGNLWCCLFYSLPFLMDVVYSCLCLCLNSL